MTKKILNIRFIEHGKKYSYTIQRKTFFGWCTYRYAVGAGAGYYVTYEYTGISKEILIEEILNEKYATTKEFVRIIEHPMIKKY